MTARKGDAELGILFEADKQNFIIESINDSKNMVFDSLGYSDGELVNSDLRKIFTEDINESIDDYLEVDGNVCNIVPILSKTRNFALRSKDGKNVQIVMRINADVSMDDSARYRMVIRDSKQSSSGLQKAIAVVSEYEVLDENLRVSTREFYYKKLDIVTKYISEHNLPATIAIIKLDKYQGTVDLYGDGTGLGLLNEVVARCKTAFRDADVIGYLGDGIFGVVLLEAEKTTSLIPLNRLRAMISDQPMFHGENTNVKASISVLYTDIDAEKTSKEMVESCIEALENEGEEGNLLIQL